MKKNYKKFFEDEEDLIRYGDEPSEYIFKLFIQKNPYQFLTHPSPEVRDFAKKLLPIVEKIEQCQKLFKKYTDPKKDHIALFLLFLLISLSFINFIFLGVFLCYGIFLILLTGWRLERIRTLSNLLEQNERQLYGS